MPRTKTITLYEFDELSDKAKERARDWYRESEAHFFDAEDFEEHVLREHVEYHFRLKLPKCRWSLNHCQGDGVAFYGAIDLDFLMDDGDARPDQLTSRETLEEIRSLVRDLRGLGYSLRADSDGEGNGNHHWNSMRATLTAEEGPNLSRYGLRAAITDEMLLAMEPPMLATVSELLEGDDWAPLLIACDWLDEQGFDTALIRAIVAPGDGCSAAEAMVERLQELLDEYLTAASRSAGKAGYEELEYRDGPECIDENIRINDFTFTADGKRMN